jgi:hypothetical protein
VSRAAAAVNIKNLFRFFDYPGLEKESENITD